MNISFRHRVAKAIELAEIPKESDVDYSWHEAGAAIEVFFDLLNEEANKCDPEYTVLIRDLILQLRWSASASGNGEKK